MGVAKGFVEYWDRSIKGVKLSTQVRHRTHGSILFVYFFVYRTHVLR